MHIKGIALVVILLLISVSVVPSTSRDVEQSSISPLYDGKTLYVGGSGPGNYTSIQDAIDNASDGDTVFVYNDSSPYVENVVVNKSINLIGEDKDSTVIDGNMIGDVVYVTAYWVNITGFTITNGSSSKQGIDLRSNHCRITDNNIISNKREGIYLEGSNYNNISGNYFSQNRFSIYLWDSENNIISGNNILNNTFAIILRSYSSNNNISSNIIIGNDQAELIYIFDEDCNDNSIIYNQLSNGKEGIRTSSDSTSNNNFTGNTINNCKYNGMYLTEISNSIVYGNIISNCGSNGIYCSSCNFNVISNNSISFNSEDGLYIFTSTYNTIFDNTINFNGGHGFYLTSSGWNIISNNNIDFNGIYGLSLYHSDSNMVFNNKIYSNSGDGLHFTYSSNNNKIFNNNISLNIGSAIRIEDVDNPSFNNYIYHNNFINNSLGGYDECNNTWDYGYPSGGNYWSDYNGSDYYRGANQNIQGSDSIGDTPYNLSGGDNQDRYPLIYPWGEQRPVANYTYTMEYGGYVFDGSPSYDRDGVVLFYEWDFGDGSNGQGMTVVHGFNETGTYNVTLVVTDDDGYQGSYTMSIDAVKNNPPSTPLIDGPVEEKARKSHLYDFTSEDPDLADVSYYIEWGDGAIEDWSGFQPSGEPYSSNHGWAKGTYTIRCKSRDIYGAESGWGTLKVTMPKYVWFMDWLNKLPLLRWLMTWFIEQSCLQSLFSIDY